MILKQFLPASACSNKLQATDSHGSSHSAVSNHWTNFADTHFHAQIFEIAWHQPK
jgi:hypothetical protein